MEVRNNFISYFMVFVLSLRVSYCALHVLGSCDFEGEDWMCGYEQSTTRDNFNWSHVNMENGNHIMQINTELHSVGEKAQLITPEIQQKDTHCFSSEIFIGDTRTYDSDNSTSSYNLESTAELNIYVLDHDNRMLTLPAWNSSQVKRNVWLTVQLALNPRAYQIVFEGVVKQRAPGAIAIDNVLVSPSACVDTPHFLRLGEKEVNSGQNETLQCLLWGHNGLDTHVVLQKLTGETFLPFSKLKFDDHLSATFSFTDVMVSDHGLYRCVSRNQTKIGISNYAQLSVRVPPRPKRGPKLVQPGATNFIVQLNAVEYTGDGPIVQTILYYKPVDGSWSDVHHIDSENYHLWTLQPDTEYELAVTLVRPGKGGTGQRGPVLRRKTTCGIPKYPVQNVAFVLLNPHEVKVSWDEPDLSITQCHNFAFVVKYKLYNKGEEKASYETLRVQNQNVAVIPGLEDFSKYVFKIELTNVAGSKETGDYIIQTLEGVPGIIPPESFACTHFNDTSISLKWNPPLKPNGIILYYEVSYRGESSSDPNFVPENSDGLIEVSGEETTLVLTSLNAGTNYRIFIRAKTSAGYGRQIDFMAKTDIAPPTLPQYPPPKKGGDSVTTPTTIEITIIPAMSNGAPITNYFVIVEDVTRNVNSQPSSPQKVKNSSDLRRGKRKKKKKRNGRSRRQAIVDVEDKEPNACQKPPISYQEAMRSNQTSYAGARFSPDEITNEKAFVVGDNSASDGFENRPLDPNKDYNVYVRVESTYNGETKVSCVLVAQKVRAPPSPVTPSQSTTEKVKPDGMGKIDGNNENNEAEGPSTSAVTPDQKEQKDEQKILFAGVGIAILAIVIVIIIIILLAVRYKRRNKACRKDRVVNPFEVRMMMSDMSSPAHTLLAIRPAGDGGTSDRQSLMPDVVGYDHQDFLEKASENDGTAYGAHSNDERFAIRVDDFHVHVSQMKATGGYGFREEFASFHNGPSAAWLVADGPQNRSKNRYGNILAYDHSRVVLDSPPGHEDEFMSDYINASYINGYKAPSMYIAAQAPTQDTCEDFWWMVWQEKTNVIVMVTNLVEMSKHKCHKYWPDDRELYGTVQVSLANVEYVADYVIRSFLIQQSDGYDVREIKQFHFTAWPDHGVPSRPTNLLSFIRRIKVYEPQGQGPTIVHCSAGSGRTGCFMVIDMMLDMAQDEEVVDIFNTVRDLRSRRVNMVQTEEQYVFIHEAVLEALICGETLVAADMLVEHYDELIRIDSHTRFAPIQEEFETLNMITPKLTDEECSVARLPRNRASNRFMDVLPADRHLPYLITPDPADRDNNYINAVYLDSYSTKNAILVTQMPLPSTVIDIWRLVYDHNCTSIVMMNDISEHDQTCSQYWPEGGTAALGAFSVELLTQDDEVDVITRLFKLQNMARPSEPYRVVQQFQLTNWPAAQAVPFSRDAFLKIIQLVNKWQAKCSTSGDAGRTLVHCVAGAGRSGTFVSCFNICEQLRQELSVDVFNAVQRLRNIRPQLVETLEQYRFCYELGIEFADQ